ncbi:6-phosphogluconolactonase [soil metagenome]
MSFLPYNAVVLNDAEALAQEAARQFVALARATLETHDRFTVALSGGSTPKRMYELLAEKPFKDEVDWSKVHIFFGDERMVAPDTPESNYFVAVDKLLAHVPVPDENIFPYVTLGVSAEDAAELYAQELTNFFGGTPTFDLVFLGLGEDGHTASLFPSHEEMASPSDKLVVAVHDAPKPPPTRLTLTYKTLNAAKNILCLVGGKGKVDALERIFKEHEDLPAAKVQPTDGQLLWLLDKAAARGLE